MTSPAPRGLPLTFYAVAEPEPGPGWQGLFSSAWPAYRPYITGCSQAVHLGVDRALVRNYDYAPELLERVVLGSSFTGRPATGTGFGIPLVLRYVLEVFDSAAQRVTRWPGPRPGTWGRPGAASGGTCWPAWWATPALTWSSWWGASWSRRCTPMPTSLASARSTRPSTGPTELALEYRWPGSAWKHTIGSFADGRHEVVLGAR